MKNDNNSIMRGDRTEQARLALNLVDCMGLDSAIFACRANGWDGVLKFLTGDRHGGRRRAALNPVFHV